MNKKFQVRVKENKKYNSAEYDVYATCESSEGAKNLVHAQLKNLVPSKSGVSYAYGNKIEILSVKEIKEDEVK